MPSRRTSTNPSLVPVQEISVNAFSAFNSDNVNSLTRILSGFDDKPVICSGIESTGTARPNADLSKQIRDYNRYSLLSDLENCEVEPTPRFFEQFDTPTSLVDHWQSTNAIQDSGSALLQIPSPSIYARCKIKALNTYGDISASDISGWFKISFNLSGATSTSSPKRLIISLGGQNKILEYPQPKSDPSDPYVCYLQLLNFLDEFGNINQLSIIADLDDEDALSASYIRIDNIKLERVIKLGSRIIPIIEQEIEDNTPISYLHPHEELQITPGIIIKDRAVLALKGLTPYTEPISKLTYGNADSWINGNPFTSSNFNGTSYFWDGSSSTPVDFNVNGVLETPSLDDGEVGGPRKIDGDSRTTNPNPPVIQWAYLVCYYSFLKSPTPNTAAIGICHLDEAEDPRYGEDFMIIAKIRFIDVNTVDAIFYYPYRKDLFYLDSQNVSYHYLNELLHWDYRPQNTSQALDMLAKAIFEKRGIFYFPTHQNFLDWKDHVLPCGTGHGPSDYKQYTDGLLWQNAYDQLAYVIDTNTFWRSKIKSTDGINPDLDVYNQFIIDWYEIQNKRFEIKWTDGEWADRSGGKWEWFNENGASDVVAGIDEFTSANIGIVLGNLTTNVKSLTDAKTDWPHKYYVIKNALNNSFTVVNPYNQYGSGSVPGVPSQTNLQKYVLRATNEFLPVTGSATGDINVIAGTDTSVDHDGIKVDESTPVDTLTFTVKNTGIVKGASGNGISVSESNAHILTISNTGVLKIIAGTGISINPTSGTGDVEISNIAIPPIYTGDVDNAATGGTIISGSIIKSHRRNSDSQLVDSAAGVPDIPRVYVDATNQRIQINIYSLQVLDSYIQSGPVATNTDPGDINGRRLNIGGDAGIENIEITGERSSIIAGYNNTIEGNNSSIIAGYSNKISHSENSIIAGHDNDIQQGNFNSILSGFNNIINNTNSANIISGVGHNIKGSGGAHCILGSGMCTIDGTGSANIFIGTGSDTGYLSEIDSSGSSNICLGGYDSRIIGQPNRVIIINGSENHILNIGSGAIQDVTCIGCQGFKTTNPTTPPSRSTFINCSGTAPTGGGDWLADKVYINNVDKTSCFKITHPLPSLSKTKVLVHSCIEGPKIDLIYRGKIQLKDGEAQINIDESANMAEGTFETLTHFENSDIFLQNNTGWDKVRGKLNKNILTIESQNQRSEDTISWSVISERNDDTIKMSPKVNKEGHLITEFDIIDEKDINKIDKTKYIIDQTQDKTAWFKIPLK